MIPVSPLVSLVAAAALSFTVLPAAAAVPPQALTIERLFAAPDLAGGGLRGLRFSPDGRRATWLQGAADDKDRLDLWAYDLATGKAARLVDARALVPQEGRLSAEEEARRERARTSAFRGILEYSFAADGRRLLFPLGGDLYLYDLALPADRAVRRLTQTEAFETDARFSPRGRLVSFVRDQDLWVIDLATGAERAITSDGDGLITNGAAEFIAQEELDRDTGYWWSPDERYLAYARVDESPVPEVTRSEILADGIRTVQQRYPAAGQPNALVSLFVMPLAGGAPARVDLGTDPDFYLARVDWRPDARKVFVQRLSRSQQQLDLLLADAVTGSSAVLLTERSDTWVELHDFLRPLRDGGFVWGSQRSGFPHLYRHDAAGRQVAVLTQGEWSVTALSAIDEAGGQLYFAASRDGHHQRRLYAVRLDGRDAAKPRTLTPEAGWHAVQVARDTRYFLDTHSSVDLPPRILLRRIDGRVVTALVPNSLDDAHPYAPYLSTHPRYEFGTLPAVDGQRLPYMVAKPHDFDPARRYPVVVSVYGGPHGQMVMNAWDDGFTHYLVRRGYVVFSLDNRGAANQGMKMDGALFRRMAGVEVEDQVTGARWLAQQPWVEGSRIGVFGWSYGGYMTLNLMFRAPGVFAVGVAGAPVTDWSLYDTAYTERYMGTPQANPEGYAAASALGVATQLAGPLLVVHGMADDNVLFENSTKLFKVLQEAGKPFDVMVYPGHKHGMLRHASVGPHAYHAITAYLDRYLKPPPGLTAAQ